MLRQNGGCKVVVAAPEGLKMELAKKLGAGDVCLPAFYIDDFN
jgi:D-arabinitol dehydrogenase (NADP+)